MAVFYHAENISFPAIKRREITRWIKKVADHHQKRVGEINYIFCDDAEILRINREFLDHDYYTDIITFDYTEGKTISGDLYISLDTVKSNAEKFSTNPNEELLRVIIHGILHLCGFADKTVEEEISMRDQENRALSLLKTEN